MLNYKLPVSFSYFKWMIPNLPDSVHPAAQQKTPFNLNRYVLLLVYIIYTFLSSCPYFGWRSISHMLIKSKAYEWLCNEDSVVELTKVDNARFLCNEQDLNVQQLFTIAMACHFSMSAVSGILMDFISPKIVAIFGQNLNIIGWLLLAFCSSSFRAYIPAFVFIGAGADTSFLSTLKLANLFPGSRAICTSILGAAVSASFSIPLIMDTIWENNEDFSFFSLCIGYVFCGPVLCVFIVLFLFPYKSFTDDIELKKLVAASSPCTKQEKIEDNAFVSGFTNMYNNVGDVNGKNVNVENNNEMELFEDISLDIPENNESSASRVSGGDECNVGNSVLSMHLVMNNDSNSNILLKSIKQETNLIKIILSKYFIVISVYFILCSISMVYYQEAAGRLFSIKVENALSMLLPFSFFPCILAGKMIDVYGIMPLIVFINLIGASMYFLVCFKITFFHYISVMFYTIYISVYTSQLYCYIGDTFVSCHFGKLLGIVSCVGGLLSLLTHYIYQGVTVNLMHGNTILMNIIFTVLIFILTPVLFYILLLKRKASK